MSATFLLCDLNVNRPQVELADQKKVVAELILIGENWLR